MRSLMLASVAVALVMPAAASPAFAPTPADSNFTESVWFSNAALSDATSMAWAPDGRLFVTLKAGSVRVINAAGTQMTTWFTFGNVVTSSECGLLSVALHPQFATNGFAYFFVTVNNPTLQQRICRVTDVGGLGQDMTPIVTGLPTVGANHDGGALTIGPDGNLYWAIGDLGNGTGVDADLSSFACKVARANLSGQVVPGGPWYNAADGITTTDYLWARGFRNPYTMTWHPTTNQLWVNVVGTNAEQIFLVGPGDHAGWNDYEGGNQPAGMNAPPNNSVYIDPKFSYPTNGGTYGGCITGGVFYTGTQFPSSYLGNFFWGDYNSGMIMRSVLNAAGDTITNTSVFVTGVNQVVDITVGPDGALYYKGRGNGNVYRLAYTNIPTVNILTTPSSLTVNEGGGGAFNVTLSAAPAGTVTVGVARTSGSASVNPSPAALTFTPGNFGTPQTVTVGAAEDAGAVTDGATITCSAPGLASQSVVVTAVDNDGAAGAPSAIIVNPANGATVSGATAEFYGNGSDDVGCVNAEFAIDGQVVYTDVNSSNHFHIGGAHNLWNTTTLSDGPHVLRMTVYDGGGLSGSHEIVVNVSNGAPLAWQQSVDGLVSIQAEAPDGGAPQGGHSWDEIADAAASGGSAMQAGPNDGTFVDTGFVTGSPRLDYRINFVATGTHFVWIRGRGPTGADNTVHVGLDGAAVATADNAGEWGPAYGWMNTTLDGPVATVNVQTVGAHMLNLWMREDGFVVDRIVLTTSPTLIPAGAGPPLSPRAAMAQADPPQPGPGNGGGGGGGSSGCGALGADALLVLGVLWLALRRR